MRGVVSGGTLAALEDRGLLSVFDTVHGSSVGALTAAYFVAGQARLGTTIFYEDINNKQFINPLRALIGRPILDKDFLVEKILRFQKPLDVGSILKTRGFLHIVTTDVTSGNARVIDTFRNQEHLFQVLKASVCLPIIAGVSVEVDGLQLFDGGLTQQIPLSSAVAAGATHILVVIPRKKAELHRRSRKGLLRLPSLALELVYGKRIANLYQRQDSQINADLAYIASGRASNGAMIDAIMRSPQSGEVGLFTIDRAVLLQVDADARRAAYSYVDGT